MALPNPVIVVPGIIASYLRDLYPIPPQTIWSVMTSDYDRAALHPDELKDRVPAKQRAYEAKEPAHIVADQVYEIAYKELIEELRFNLRSKEDEPVPVYGFGYDWRQPLEVAQRELAAFTDEVIRRTALLRHYHREGYTEKSKVNLVGHSMGGLVIAGYLANAGAAHRVDKVVSLGSPFQGSFEAIVKVTTGNANLGAEPPSSREREAARMTPGLYHLVPSFADGLTVDPPFPKDLFNPDAWQPSIVDTIAEYIRLRGREKLTVTERRAMAAGIFAAMLKAAKSHRRGLDKLDLNAIGLKGAWLCVVGVDSVTRVHLRRQDRAEARIRLPPRGSPQSLVRPGRGQPPSDRRRHGSFRRRDP